MARKNRRRRNRLALEKLEDRRLLAVAAFEAELYSDVDGVPGELLADNTVTAGDTFFLRVTAREFDRFRDGLGSAAVSIDWNPGLIRAIEADFQLESVITSDLPLMQSGSLDNASGAIDDLSGLALLSGGSGRAIGNGIAETFAMIRMQAGADTGQGEIELSESLKKTITVPTTVLRGNDLRFDAESITVVAANATSENPEAPPNENAEPSQEPSETNETGEDESQMTTSEDSTTEAAPAAEGEVATTNEEPIILATATAPEGESTIEEGVDRVVVVARPIAVESSATVQADETAAAVDEVMSFDLNEDGIFDFADFGLLNVTAATAQAAPEAATDDLTQSTGDAGSNDDSQLPFHGICTAAPPREDVPAFEAWMDALANAWIADAQARDDRREANTLF